jgi:hypothetical protein
MNRQQRCVPIAESLQQPGRAFDIGKDKRDVTRRQHRVCARTQERDNVS